MKLIFVRHCDPDYKIDSLTEKGCREAEMLAARIGKMDVRDFYVSTMGRARDTARIAMKSFPAHTATELHWFREFDRRFVSPTTGRPGEWFWYLHPSFLQNEPMLHDPLTWQEHPIVKEEDAKKEYDLVMSSLDDILLNYGYKKEGRFYRCENNVEDTIVFFGHMGTTLAIISYLCGLAPVAVWNGIYLPPSSITMFVTEEREKGLVRFRAHMIGDTSHLYAADEPLSNAASHVEIYQPPVI